MRRHHVLQQRRSLLVAAALMVAGCGPAGTAASGVAFTGDLSAEQRSVLADGTVTFAEYEQSMTNLVECLRAEGLTARGPLPEGDDPYYLAYEILMDRSETRIEAVQRTCERTHTSEVELTWADQNAPSQEEDDQFYAFVADCLEDAGLDPGGGSSEELSALIDSEPATYDQCFDRATDRFPE